MVATKVIRYPWRRRTVGAWDGCGLDGAGGGGRKQRAGRVRKVATKIIFTPTCSYVGYFSKRLWHLRHFLSSRNQECQEPNKIATYNREGK